METVVLTRAERIALVAKRDGPDCFLCKKPFRRNDEITLDHWMPQSWCFTQGWTMEQVWNISNLRLAHKPCNAKKGDLVPIDDVTVPTRNIVKAPTRAERREIRQQCDLCMNGRVLLIGEECPECGSGPQPASAPKALQVEPKQCDHDTTHCWMCFIGHVARKSAISSIIGG